MKLQELDTYLRDQIPLVRALETEILRADENSVEIHAPLAPNRNHLGTVFGGSTNAVSVLACYSWLFNILDIHKFKCHVVIKSSRIQYLRPLKSGFSSICSSPGPEELDKFLKTLKRRNKAQIVLRSEITTGSEVACQFEGEFVAQC